MFKKSKRSFRQRTRHSDSDEDDEEKNTAASSIQEDNTNDSTLNSKLYKFDPGTTDSNEDSNSNFSFKSSSKQTDRKTTTKLSFVEDEEDEDVFIVKKSLYSRRMEKNKQKLLKSKTISTNNNSNDDNDGKINSHNKKQQSNFKDDPSVVLDSKEKLDSEIIVCPGSDDENEDDEDGSSKQEKTEVQFRTALERGIIPDAKTIYELKKQRQKLARTTNEDFIPLENDDSDANNNATSSSRLVHESDEDKSEDGDLPNSDDEKNDRIQFGNINYQIKEKEKFKERFRELENEESSKPNNKYSHQDDNSFDESDEDVVQDEKSGSKDNSEDEMDKWEREQIRKAVRLPNIYSYSKSEMNNKYLTDDNTTLINKLQVIHDNHNVVPIEVDQETKTFGNYIPAFISDRSNNQDDVIDSFGDRIQNARKQLELKIEENNQLYDRVCMELRLASRDVETYDPDVEQLTDDYNFYRNMLDYVRNLCDCINDKLSLLEKIEAQTLEMYRKLAETSLERHRNFIQDLNSISLHFIMNHKAFSIQYGQMTLNSILDVYDFGSDDEKRQRCLQRQEQRLKKRSAEQEDSDDENEDQRKLLQEMKSKLEELFDDTDDDFASIKGIVEQFKRWKMNRLDTYKESFVNEFLPKFLTYYLRYELVLWNIFDRQSKLNLIELDGIKSLFQYVTFDWTNNLETNNKIDVNVIPALIENSVIPKITTLIDIWNPLSTRQTNRLVTFLNLLLSNFPTLVDTSENILNILQKIVLRIEKTIENDVFIPQMIPSDFFGKIELTNSYESMVKWFVVDFFDHQYWQTFRLMNNVIAFRNIIDDQIIREMALEKICSRYLIMSIQRSAPDPEKTFNKLQKLITNIPKEWIRQNASIQNQFNNLFQHIQEQKSLSDEWRMKISNIKHSITFL